MRRLFLLTGALILYGSLFPWRFHALAPGFDLQAQLYTSWPDELNRWLIKDGLLNIAVYVPFGWIGAVAFSASRWKSWAMPTICAIGLSFGVEYAQLYTFSRTTSAFDFMANVTGALIGVFIAHRFRTEWRARDHLRKRADELLILALFLNWQLFPFFPVSGRTALYANFGELPNFTWLAFVTAFVGWLCGGMAASSLLRGQNVLWLLCVLLIKPFMIGRFLALSEIAGAALALIAVRYAVPRPGIVAAAAAGLVALRETMPIRFSRSASEFNWIPFQASLGASDWLRASGILADKLFLITAIIWLLRRSGARLWWSTVTVAIALLGLELLQTHLPERTPESTDAVLALAGGLLLDLVERRRTRSR